VNDDYPNHDVIETLQALDHSDFVHCLVDPYMCWYQHSKVYQMPLPVRDACIKNALKNIRSNVQSLSKYG
jgi:hypothetical protein